MTVAQDENLYVKKNYVIALSTKDYAGAKAFATKAAKALNYKLDLRDLKPHITSGLTWTKHECEEGNGWDYPCYVARGRVGNETYVSVEWSNAIEGFAPGYYIVILYSGEKAQAKNVLQKAKKYYKDAYVKEARVYMGCMH